MFTSRRRFLSQLSLGALGLAGMGSPEVWGAPGDPSGSGPLPRGLPEEQGVSSQGLLEFVDAVEQRRLNLHSFMCVRRGRVVAEGWWSPYAPNLRHTLYSLSKSFTSTGVGLAAAEGKLSLDDRVIDHFPDEAPTMVGEKLAQMRVRHLLMMGGGHSTDPLSAPTFRMTDRDWVTPMLAHPVEHVPGTHFVYSSGASFLLSALVQKTTGQGLLEFLTPRLLEPLGIEGADWEQNPAGINTGGWGLRVRTEDIAKFGQLYLQRGEWHGRRIISDPWIESATSRQIDNAPTADAARRGKRLAQGYGFQFWRCRHGAFRGDGAFGQFCVVLPDRQAVLAITAETNDLQGVLDAVWEILLPALRADRLPADAEGSRQLRTRLAGLTLPKPEGKPTSETAGRVDKRVFTVAENSLGVTRATFTFRDGVCTIGLNDASGEHRVECGLGDWRTGTTRLSPAPLHLVNNTPAATSAIAGAAAWSDPQTLSATWRFIETAHYENVVCRFADNGVRIEFQKSASILNPKVKDERPALIGT